MTYIIPTSWDWMEGPTNIYVNGEIIDLSEIWKIFKKGSECEIETRNMFGEMGVQGKIVNGEKEGHRIEYDLIYGDLIYDMYGIDLGEDMGRDIIEYYFSGPIRWEGKYHKGKKEGEWIGFGRGSDEIVCTGNYDNGKKEGHWCEFWLTDGNLNGYHVRWEGKYHRGKKEGEWIGFDKNSNVKCKGTYKNGEKEGNWQEYWITEEGLNTKESEWGGIEEEYTILWQGNYKNGKKEGKWIGCDEKTGYQKYQYLYHEGKRRECFLLGGPGSCVKVMCYWEGPYLFNVRHGRWGCYSSDGRIIGCGKYEYGKKVGLWLEPYENHYLIGEYKDGELVYGTEFFLKFCGEWSFKNYNDNGIYYEEIGDDLYVFNRNDPFFENDLSEEIIENNGWYSFWSHKVNAYFSGKMNENKRDGFWSYDNNGNVLAFCYYEKGKKTGFGIETSAWYNNDNCSSLLGYRTIRIGEYNKYSGCKIGVRSEYEVTWYGNGCFQNNKKEGWWEELIENEIWGGEYKNGLKNGIWGNNHDKWCTYENGIKNGVGREKNFEGSYVNGKKEGERILKDGDLTITECYKNGQISWSVEDEYGDHHIEIHYKNGEPLWSNDRYNPNIYDSE